MRSVELEPMSSSARLTVHAPGSPARSIPLPEGESVLIGRDSACALALPDPRVSSRHALLFRDASGWRIVDQGSETGTFVNGLPVREAALAPGDWISIGRFHAQLEVLTEQQAENERLAALERRTAARDVRERLTWEAHPEEILLRLVESVVEVAGAERGFLLTLGPDGGIEPQAAVGFAAHEERFDGSAAAVRRVLATGRSVVADAQEHAFVGKRPSAKELGRGALACVPLTGPARGDVFGVLYVDGRRAGGSFTELDLELLEELAGKAALLLEGMRIGRRLREFLRDPRQAAILELLSRRLDRGAT